MAELPPIKLPSAAIGDEVVVTSEETGQVWNIVATNSKKTRRRFRAMTAPTLPAPTPTPTPSPTTPPAGVTFYDDFPGTTWDPAKWTGPTEWPTIGLSSESDNMGTMQQVSVANSLLRIRCERGSTPSGRPWRSGAISTKGKFQQLYGIFTARMQYPKGQGLWPAFWLLQGDGASGPRPELDVIEAYPFGSSVSPFPKGGGPTQYAMTNHYKDSSGMHAVTTWCKPGYDLTGAFHDFELEWRAGLLIARCDGKEMGRQTANVPAVPMFVIFDHVVGGWAGVSDATTPSPADLLVDWVRVLP